MLDPESVVRQLWDAINERDYARVAGAIAETCTWQSMPTDQTYIGPQAMVDSLRAFHDRFPNGATEIECLHLGGNSVVVEWRTSGAAVDGRSFTRRGCSVDRQSLADQLDAGS